MNVSILRNGARDITVGCNCAYLVNSENILAMKFENDDLARDTELLLKQQNIKTKHNNSEISVLNISEYELRFT